MFLTLTDATNLLSEEIRSLDASVRIVLIHSVPVTARALFNLVLPAALYLRVPAAKVTPDDMQSSIVDLVRETAVNGADRQLVLDEADRISTGELTDLLNWILDRDLAQRVFLIGRDGLANWMRESPLNGISHEVKIGRAIAPDRPPDGRDLLQVDAFGRGVARLNHRAIRKVEWNGEQVFRLFFYFIDQSRGVHRDKIFNDFWPNFDRKDATNVFHVTKNKVKNALGKELVKTKAAVYRLSEDYTLFYDVEIFEGLIAQAQQADSPEKAAELMERAVKVQQTDFLTQMNAPWVIERRKELRMLRAESYLWLSEYWLSRNNLRYSWNNAMHASRMFPEREDFTRAAMKTSIELGDIVSARKVYVRLADHLKSQLSIMPSRDLTQLYESLPDS